MTQSFFIDTVLPGANDVLRIHPQVYSRMKRDYGMLVRVAIRRAKLRPMDSAHIIFRWYEKAKTGRNQRDPDNIRFGAKFVLDSLVAEGVLLDDSIDYVGSLSDEFMYAMDRPGVFVELTGRPRKKEPS
jgi:hypothetical protein